ncbi:MAG: hypothetical protein ACFFD1_11540 [Candidatus Thorarchaeota archaeon]
MSGSNNHPELQSEGISVFIKKHRIDFTAEVLFIYLMVVITLFTFFDFYKTLFYAFLGYIALLMFLTIFIYVIARIAYNFGYVIYYLLK